MKIILKKVGLQCALKNGDRRLVATVLSWYQKIIGTKEFQSKILLNRTEDGFTLLQSAVKRQN